MLFDYSAILVFVFSLSCLLTIILRRLASVVDLVDRSKGRKQHSGSVELVGGLIIFFSTSVSLFVFTDFSQMPWFFVISIFLIIIVGVVDDRCGLPVRTRIFVQIFATILVLYGHSIWIRSVGLGFFGWQFIPSWLGIPFTIFSVVALTNGFNMVDGIDGLAAGLALIAIASLGIGVYMIDGFVDYGRELLIFATVIFSFWLINMSLTPLRRVFLGDAGSTILGFLISWFLIFYTHSEVHSFHPVAALWCVSVPIFDTISTVIQRIQSGRSPFLPDRTHLHHLLVDNGMGHRSTLYMILFLSIGLSVFGIFLTECISPAVGLLAFVFMGGLFALWRYVIQTAV